MAKKLGGGVVEQIDTTKGVLEQTYSALLDAICDGTLPPLERLVEHELAERLGVSRQPVHQALLQLKAQGFVREVGRRGLGVAPLELSFVRDLYDIRLALDKLTARRAAERAGSGAKARGLELIYNAERAIAREGARALMEHDVAFHAFLYGLAGNALIQRTLEPTWHHLRRVMQAVTLLPNYQRVILEEHRAILEAVAEGGAARAEALAEAHVVGASATLQSALAAQAETRTEPHTEAHAATQTERTAS